MKSRLTITMNGQTQANASPMSLLKLVYALIYPDAAHSLDLAETLHQGKLDPQMHFW